MQQASDEYEIRRYLRVRQQARAFRLASMLSLVLVAVFAVIYRGTIFGDVGSLLVSGGAATLAVALALMEYLRSESLVTGRFRTTPYGGSYYYPRTAGLVADEQLAELQAAFRELRSDMARLAAPTAGVSEADRDRLVSSIRDEVSEGARRDAIRYVEDHYTELAVRNANYALSHEQLTYAANRLRDEIRALTKRGNINLMIGTVTTIMAVAVLVYMVVGIQQAALTQIPQLLAYYIPRVTTVVFIEVFSFFFLRLYRSSLVDIKYYQNELTNVEVRGAALISAHASGNEAALTSVLERMGGTERNPNGGMSQTRANETTSKELIALAQQILKLADRK